MLRLSSWSHTTAVCCLALLLAVGPTWRPLAPTHRGPGVATAHAADLPPVSIVLDEGIGLADAQQVYPPVSITLEEGIGLADEQRALADVAITVDEGIGLADTQQVYPPVSITVDEGIGLADTQQVYPPVSITVDEGIGLADTQQVYPPVSITVDEGIALADEQRVLPSVAITVDEGIGLGDTSETMAPERPRLTAAPFHQVQYSDFLQFSVSATDADGPASALRFSATGLPEGLGLADHLDGTATISGTVRSAAGDYSPSITVVDADGMTDARSVAIMVIREDAGVRYSGTSRVFAGSPITLTATVTQAMDGRLGDITRAAVRYWLVDAGDSHTMYGPVAPTPAGLASAVIPGGLASGVYSVTVEFDTANTYFQGPQGSGTALIVVDPTTQLRPVQYVAGLPRPGYSYSLPYFQFWQRVRILNVGSVLASSVRAYIERVAWGTDIVDGEVTVGNIAAGSSAWSYDNFTLRVDLRVPANKCDSFTWRIVYVDLQGDTQVLRHVPQYPPGLAPGGCR